MMKYCNTTHSGVLLSLSLSSPTIASSLKQFCANFMTKFNTMFRNQHDTKEHFSCMVQMCFLNATVTQHSFANLVSNGTTQKEQIVAHFQDMTGVELFRILEDILHIMTRDSIQLFPRIHSLFLRFLSNVMEILGSSFPTRMIHPLCTMVAQSIPYQIKRMDCTDKFEERKVPLKKSLEYAWLLSQMGKIITVDCTMESLEVRNYFFVFFFAGD